MPPPCASMLLLTSMCDLLHLTRVAVGCTLAHRCSPEHPLHSGSGLQIAEALSYHLQAAYTAVPSAPPANEQTVSIPILARGNRSIDDQTSTAFDRSRFRKPHAAGTT